VKLIVSYQMLDRNGNYLFEAAEGWSVAHIRRLRDSYAEIYRERLTPFRFVAIDVLGGKTEIPLDNEAI